LTGTRRQECHSARRDATKCSFGACYGMACVGVIEFRLRH
jgi:hypothetical protein